MSDSIAGPPPEIHLHGSMRPRPPIVPPRPVAHIDGGPVKGTGPKVYLFADGVLHWIPDPDTLQARYGGWDAVVSVTDEQLGTWAEGEPVPSVHDPIADVRMCFAHPVSDALFPARRELVAPPALRADGTLEELAVLEQPLVSVTDKRWDVGETLTVGFVAAPDVAANVASDAVRQKIMRFANEWSTYANIYLRVVDVADATIRIALDDDGQSWSNVGRDALTVGAGMPTMHFGWLTEGTSDAEYQRVVLHEFGHAIGLEHELESPAATINWDREKVFAHYADTDGWDRARVEANLFSKLPEAGTDFTAFDGESIMAYWIPASLTTDGHGVAGGDDLSPTDRGTIGQWYPFTPKSPNRSGSVQTGDDCDLVAFALEHGMESRDQVRFTLTPGAGITWWKAIEIPLKGGSWARVEMKDGATGSRTLPVSSIDWGGRVRFWKAKFLGVGTKLDFEWRVLPAILGGDRLTLTWQRDRC